MAGTLAAGPVTRAATPRCDDGRFAFSVATQADDDELRALLAAHPFDGEIRVTLEREPCFADASRLDGDVSETLVARDRTTGRIVAMGTRSERDVYINGADGRVGYLGQLRIAPAFRRHRQLLLQGFTACRALHHAGRVRFYLASIVADNHRASRLLTSPRLRRGPDGLPRFTEYARVETLLLPTTRARSRRLSSATASMSSSTPLRIVRGTEALRTAIAACLERNHRRFQLAPCGPLHDNPGLRIEDFFVARRGDDIIGCLARWDQRRFKQVRVCGYAPGLGRWRRVINAVAPLVGTPRLPEVGATLAFAYLSHVAIDHDDPRLLRALVETARAAPVEVESGQPPLDYVVLGLAAGHPLLAAFTGTRARRYVSQLYLVSWEDGRAAIDAIDDRLPHVEVATL